MRWREGGLADSSGDHPQSALPTAPASGGIEKVDSDVRQGAVVRIHEMVRRAGTRLVATAIAFGTLTGGVIFGYVAFGPGTMAYATPVNIVDESNRIDDGMVDVRSLTGDNKGAEATAEGDSESNLARRGTYTQLTREQIANAQPVPALVVLDGNRVGTDLKTLVPSTDAEAKTVMGRFDAKGSGLYAEQMLAADGENVIKSQEDESNMSSGDGGNAQDANKFQFGFYYYFNKFFGNFGYGQNVDSNLMQQLKASFGQYAYDGLYVYYNGQKRARVAWAGMIGNKTYVLAHDNTSAYATQDNRLVAQQCTPWKDDNGLQKGDGRNIKDETNDCFLTEVPNVTTTTANGVEVANAIKPGEPYLSASFSSTGAVQAHYGQDTRQNNGNDGGNSELADKTGRADFSLTQTTGAPGGQVVFRAYTSEAGVSLKVYVREVEKDSEQATDADTGRIKSFPTDAGAFGQGYQPWVGFDGREVQSETNGKVHYIAPRTENGAEVLDGYTPQLREYELRVDVPQDSAKTLEIYVTQSKDYGDQAPKPADNADASKVIVSGQIKAAEGTAGEISEEEMLILRQLYTIGGGPLRWTGSGFDIDMQDRAYLYCDATKVAGTDCSKNQYEDAGRQIFNQGVHKNNYTDWAVKKGRGMRGASYVAGWRIDRKDSNGDGTYEKNDYSGENGGKRVYVPGEYSSTSDYMGKGEVYSDQEFQDMLAGCETAYGNISCTYWRQLMRGGLEPPAWWDNPYFEQQRGKWEKLSIGASPFEANKVGQQTDYAYNNGRPYASSSYLNRQKTQDTAPYGIGNGTTVETNDVYAFNYCTRGEQGPMNSWNVWRNAVNDGRGLNWMPIFCNASLGNQQYYGKVLGTDHKDMTNTLGTIWRETDESWTNGGMADVTGQFGSADGSKGERGEIGDSYALAFYNSVRSGCYADYEGNPNASMGKNDVVGNCDKNSKGNTGDTGQTQIPVALQLCAKPTNSGAQSVSCDDKDAIRTTVNMPTYQSINGGTATNRTWTLDNSTNDPLLWSQRGFGNLFNYTSDSSSMTTTLTDGPFAGMTVTVRETTPWYLDQNEKFGGRKFHYSSHVMLVTLDNVTTSVDVKMVYEKAQYPTFALGSAKGMQNVEVRADEDGNGEYSWKNLSEVLAVRADETNSLNGNHTTHQNRGNRMLALIRFRPALGYTLDAVRASGGRSNASSAEVKYRQCMATDKGGGAPTGVAGCDETFATSTRPRQEYAGSELTSLDLSTKASAERRPEWQPAAGGNSQAAMHWQYTDSSQCVALAPDYVWRSNKNYGRDLTDEEKAKYTTEMATADGQKATVDAVGEYVTCLINFSPSDSTDPKPYDDFYASPVQFGSASNTKDKTYKLRFYPGYRDGDATANESGTISYNGKGTLETLKENGNTDTMRVCTADEMKANVATKPTGATGDGFHGCVDANSIDTRIQSFNLAGVAEGYGLTVPSNKPRYIQTEEEKNQGKILYFQGWAPFFGVDTTGSGSEVLGNAMMTIPGMTTSMANGIGGKYQIGEMGLIRPGQSVPVSAVTPSSSVVALRMRAVWSEVSLADAGNVRVVSYTQTYQPASGSGEGAKPEQYGWTDTLNAAGKNVNEPTSDTQMYLVLKDDATEGGKGWKAKYASASQPADLIERLFGQASGGADGGDKTFDRTGDAEGKVTGIKNGVSVSGKLSSGTAVSGADALKTGDKSTGTLAAVNFNNNGLVQCGPVVGMDGDTSIQTTSSPLLGLSASIDLFNYTEEERLVYTAFQNRIRSYCSTDSGEQLGNDPLNLGKLPSTASDVVFAALFREPAAMTYQTSGLYLPEGTTEPNKQRDRWFSIDTKNEANSTQPDKDTTGAIYSAFANANPLNTGRWKYDHVKMPTFGDRTRDAYKDSALDWRYCGYASDDGSEVDCEETQLMGDPQGWAPERGPVEDSTGQGRYQAPYFPNDGQHADDPVDQNGKPKPSKDIQKMDAVVTMTEANREWAAIWHPGGAVTLQLRKVSQAQSDSGKPDSLKGGKFRLYHLSENCYKYGVDATTQQCQTSGAELSHENINYDGLDLAKNPALLSNLGYPDVNATGSTSDNPNDASWKNQNENWHPHPTYADEFDAAAVGEDGLVTFSSLVLGGNEIAGSGGKKTLDYSKMWFALVETEAPQGYDTPSGAVWYFRIDPTVRIDETTADGKETPRSGLIYTIRTTTHKDSGTGQTMPDYGTVFSGRATRTAAGGAGQPGSAIDLTAQVPAVMTSETLAGGGALDGSYNVADLARLTNDGGLRLPMAGVSSILWRSLLVGAILTLGAWLAYDRYRRRQSPVAVTGHHLCL